MLKRKQTKGSGSQAPAPEEKPKGDHLWNGCGSEAGQDERKRTAKPSTRTGEEGMRDQAGKNGESQEAKAEGRTGEATVRRKREERKGRNRGLSSRKRNESGRKEANGKRKTWKVKAGSEHLRNGRGSESGKGERKHTAKLSTGTGKECTGNQAGENGENRGSESGNGALKKPL